MKEKENPLTPPTTRRAQSIIISVGEVYRPCDEGSQSVWNDLDAKAAEETLAAVGLAFNSSYGSASEAAPIV